MERRLGFSSLFNKDKGTQTDAKRARIKKTTALLIAGLATTGCETPLHPYRTETTSRICYNTTIESDKKIVLPTGEKIWLENVDQAFRSRACFGRFEDETFNTAEPPPIGEARERYERIGQ